jgi:hypothetical protein
MRPRFVNCIGLGGSIALLCVIGLTPAKISAQGPGDAVLDKTTLGKSQNDGRDLANSLVPGEKKFGKGEKKEEVNAADLKSKPVKDTTFGGSLLNMGIVGVEPKLDESKRRAVESEKDSSSVKQPAVTEKEPLLQLSDSAALQQKLDQSASVVADNESRATSGNATAGGSETRKKEQTATTAEPAKDQKSSTDSSEKPAAGKPDGDH